MSRLYTYVTLSPIGDTDVRRIPVASIDSAIRFFADLFSAEIVTRSATSAKLDLDGNLLGFEENDLDPKQASCYIGVTDLDAAREQLSKASEVVLSEARVEEHGGKRYRIFFAREPYGVCFCVGEPA